MEEDDMVKSRVGQYPRKRRTNEERAGKGVLSQAKG